MNNKKLIIKTILLVITLLVLSFVIRIWRITEAPASVNWDEAAVGYNAYSLYKTGRDEFGKAFPVSLRSFDDYKPALYSYLSVVPVAIFGLGEMSTRLTSVLAGTIVIFCVLYITAKLSRNIDLGLVAGLFIAFSPWAIHFSRIAFEANLAVMLYFLAAAVFIKRPNWSLAIFILSMYAYHAQRAIAIPTWLVLLWIYKKQINIKVLIVSGLLLIPLIFSFLTEPAGNRLTSTIILKLWPFVPAEFPRVIFQPIYTLLWQVVGQYLAYFSPVTLFVRGSNEPILRVPTLGLLPIEFFPIWIIGLIKIFRKSVLNKFIWVVLFFAPLPGVITWNWFSVVRTLALYPVFALIAALGMWQLPKLAKMVFWVFFGFSAWYSVLTIGVYAPYETYGDFQPGFESMVPKMMEESAKYDQVLIDSPHIAPYIFVLFYEQYPPEKYLSEAGMNRENSGTQDYTFGKFQFRKITGDDLGLKDTLLVGPTARIPDYMVQQWREKGVPVEEFLDEAGYISFRMVSL